MGEERVKEAVGVGDGDDGVVVCVEEDDGGVVEGGGGDEVRERGDGAQVGLEECVEDVCCGRRRSRLGAGEY